MKKLSERETKFLFEWVKNWFPTKEKPKITILLLNKREWREFYGQARKYSEQQFDLLMKTIREKIKELPQKNQHILKEVERLPIQKRMELLKKLFPHRIVEEEADFDYWMSESAGKCYTMQELRYMKDELNLKLPPFFKPYMDYDFVVIISNFFTKQQRKKLKSNQHRKFIIYNTIFHELIHIIEHCAGRTIFRTDKPQDSANITMSMTKKYFEKRPFN